MNRKTESKTVAAMTDEAVARLLSYWLGRVLVALLLVALVVALAGLLDAALD